MDTDLWQCLVCQQWMEQRYLDEDQICVDCNELEGKNDPEAKRDWQEARTVQGDTCTPRLLSRSAAPRWATIAAPALRWHNTCRVLALDIRTRYDTLSNYQPMALGPHRSNYGHNPRRGTNNPNGGRCAGNIIILSSPALCEGGKHRRAAREYSNRPNGTNSDRRRTCASKHDARYTSIGFH